MKSTMRIIAIVLAVFLVVFAASCGAKEEGPPEDIIDPKELENDITELPAGDYVLASYVENGEDLGGSATVVLTVLNDISGTLDLGVLDERQQGTQEVVFSTMTHTATFVAMDASYRYVMEDGALRINIDDTTYVVFVPMGSDAAAQIDEGLAAHLAQREEEQNQVETVQREMTPLNVEHGTPNVEGELFSDDHITISATEAYWDEYCFVLNMHMKSNAEQAFAVNCNAVTVNGVSVNASLYADFTEPFSEQDAALFIDASLLYQYDIVDVYTLTVPFTLFDEAYDTIEEAVFTVYPMGEENAQILELALPESALTVVENENLALYILDAAVQEDERWGEQYVVRLGIVNHTVDPMSLYCPFANVNGHGVDPYYAQDVTAQSICYSNVQFPMSALAAFGITQALDIREIAIHLQITNDRNWDEVYWDDTMTFAVPTLSEDTLHVTGAAREDTDDEDAVVIEITTPVQPEPVNTEGIWWTETVPVATDGTPLTLSDEQPARDEVGY